MRHSNLLHSLQAYTYGLCGPLLLAPSAAVLIDSSYNGGFLSGRLVSIFVALAVRPRNMIMVSLVGCFTAAIVLLALAASDVNALYGGACKYDEVLLHVLWSTALYPFVLFK